ncbi:hypothetical protein [Providencia sp. SP181]|uniref:hypothetical protein n=1 Tax=Providencia sp. SP181 TaxID=3136277 RepID=UPI003D29E3A4
MNMAFRWGDSTGMRLLTVRKRTPGNPFFWSRWRTGEGYQDGQHKLVDTLKIKRVSNMKKAMQKTVLALVAGSLMGIVGTAQAAGPVSSIVTAKADIVFEATGTATAVITPKKGLLAGKYPHATVVADAVFTASAGDVAYRWTPGTGVISNSSNNQSAQFYETTGKGGNKLKLQVVDTGDYLTSGKENAPWFVPVKIGQSTINATLETQGEQTIAPDSYPVSMDAVVWQR